MNSRFCTFFVGGQLFGIDAFRVQEIIRCREITPVPLAPPIVIGLMNLRGQIVTCISLRQRLGLVGDLSPSHAPCASDEVTRAIHVVLEADEGAVSFEVDEIADVVELDEASFEPPPETLDPANRRLIRGAHQLPGRLLLVLDADQAIDVTSPIARG